MEIVGNKHARCILPRRIYSKRIRRPPAEITNLRPCNNVHVGEVYSVTLYYAVIIRVSDVDVPSA